VEQRLHHNPKIGTEKLSELPDTKDDGS
jgi:hypothetical protein